MTRGTPEASFLYTQTPDRPPLAAVTGNDNDNTNHNNDNNLREFVLTPVILETRTRAG